MKSRTHRGRRKGRLLALLLTLAVLSGLLGTGVCAGSAEPPVTSILKEKKFTYGGYLVMEAETGRILDGDGYDNRLSMASTTKIMTCILALENGNLSDTVTVSKEAARQPEVKLGMKEGETYVLNDLLYSLMLESHNDTAVAIAGHVGGTVEGFADMMNRKAQELGCSHTYFITPNGLDASDGEGIHHTTAEDLGADYAVLYYGLSKKKKSF